MLKAVRFLVTPYIRIIHGAEPLANSSPLCRISALVPRKGLLWK